MKKNIVLIILIFSGVTNGYAQESLFGLTKIDFFNPDTPTTQMRETPQYTQIDNSPQGKEVAGEQQNVWSEPIVGPGGNSVYYTPPKQVVAFLDNPSEENAKDYLQWNMNRMGKIQQAQNMLKKVTLEMGVTPQVAMTEKKSIKNVPKSVSKRWTSGQNYIAFFLLKGCPYCEQQKQIISKLKETRSDLRIEVFVKGYSNSEIQGLPFKAISDHGISQSLGFSRYPTTLMVNKYGKKALVPGVLSDALITEFLRGQS